MKILSDHLNTKENVVLENGYVYKISKEGISEKIGAESAYYVFLLKSGHTLAKNFPKYYEHSEEKGKNKIKLEYLRGYQPLSQFILDQNISKGDSVKISKRILELLLKFSSYKKRNASSAELFERLYIERPKKRLASLCKEDMFFENLSKIKTVSINGIVYNNIEEEFFNIIDNHRDFLLSNQLPSLFHGDLHFENILINSAGSLKVVDPNGLLIGLISYDIGKLLHSIIGKYDFIQNYHYELTILGKNKFYFSVQANECFNIFSKILMKELEKKINEKLIIQSYFACWCHMISLIPHHLKNKKKQALAFYLQAIIVGDIFLNTLNKFHENHQKVEKN